MSDPTRIADMLRRRGVYGPTLELGKMRMQQDYQDQQDDKRFGQTKELRGLDQAFEEKQTKQRQDFEDQQGDKRYGQKQEMYGLETADQMMRDKQSRAWQLEDQQNQGIDSVFAMPMPDGSGYVPMVKDKGGRASAAGGFMPNKPALKQPTSEEAAKHISDSLARGVVATWDGKQWQYQQLKPQKPNDPGSETVVTDANGNVMQKTTRRKLNGQGGTVEAPPSTDPVKKPSSFLESIGG